MTSLLQKTYCCRLDGANDEKKKELCFLLSSIRGLSSFIFDNRFFFDEKDFYKACRESFPKINSKLVQKVLLRYKQSGDIFSLNGPIDCPIVFDNQMFDISFSEEGKYFDAFLRISSTKKNKRMNVPLSGLWPLRKLKEAKKIDFVEIKKHSNGSFYAHIVASFECAEEQKSERGVGIDLNHKGIVLSNNTFYSMRELVHHKDEAAKGKSASKNAARFTKNFIHQLTTQIIQDLLRKNIEVLYLEDLTNIRNKSSKKKGTSKGKFLNRRSNSFPFSMIRNQLGYKAKEVGMKVIAKKEQTIDSSKECSRCGSKDAVRKTQSSFHCRSCGFHLHADLNAARNIERKGRALLNAEMSDTPLQLRQKNQNAEVSIL